MWFWEILPLNFSLFCSLPSNYYPSKNIRYLLIVSLCKDNNNFMHGWECVCIPESAKNVWDIKREEEEAKK